MSLQSLTSLDILDFRLYLKQMDLSKRTINYHMVAIRSLLKFLAKNDIDCLDHTKIDLAKIPKRDVSYLTSDEVELLLQMPAQSVSTDLKRSRDELILYMLYSTGLRVTELISLRQDQLPDFDATSHIRVVGKGSKTRSIFVNERCQKLLDVYLAQKELLLGQSIHQGQALLVSLANNSLGKPLSRNAVEALVKHYSSLAGITKKVTPHTLRHSFATTLLKKGADLRAVQELLGHSSITTTQIYTHVDQGYLEDMHALLE